MSLKLSKEGSSSRGTRDTLRSRRLDVGRLGGQDAHGPRCVSWSWSMKPQRAPVPTHGTTLLHSRSGLELVLSVWSEQPSLGLLRDLQASGVTRGEEPAGCVPAAYPAHRWSVRSPEPLALWGPHAEPGPKPAKPIHTDPSQGCTATKRQ